ncbi:MAG TPA: ribose-phosphate diphosphokinase [Candidatus Eisenbacteria bacterium]|nr:ribose-phosphate diphosphokinase [Candidatus Eisenbacteria bacterium]
MKIVPGPSSIGLGTKIAGLMHSKPVTVTFKNFPDGESYVRLDASVKDEEVAIVQTTGPPQQDAKIIQLALLSDAAKRSGAKRVRAVVPYLAYARQDRVFLEGEALSAQAIAEMLRASGVESLITVNVHQERALSDFPFQARSVSAIGLLADYLREKGLGGAFALAPDSGAMQISREAQAVLGGGCGHLEKQRDRLSGQINIESKNLEVKGKNVVIFDDIISTGGTIVSATKIAKTLGAESVYVACVHALMIGDAEKRILDTGVEEIVASDSVPGKFSKVSVAPLIVAELSK